jgi:hypothetical protein
VQCPGSAQPVVLLAHVDAAQLPVADRFDGVQGQVQTVGREPCALLTDGQLVLLAAVVEAWLQVQGEAHGAARHAHDPDQAVLLAGVAGDDGHAVLHLAHPVRCHESSGEDRGAREVQLLADVVVPVWRDPEMASPVGV